jgi:hypothetical protein
MPAGIVGIDHPVIGVRDLEAGRLAFERLGFTVPPRGRHLEWGTGNRCVMFERDYIELRGIIDPGKPTHDLGAFLARREGLMGVAFATSGADGSYREALASGLHPKEPCELTRLFELPEGTVRPRFRLVFFDEAETPGLMRSLVCQHLTPELIRRPEWLKHPNGAAGVASIASVVADPPALADAHARLFGRDKVKVADGRLVVAVGGATIEFLSPDAADEDAVEGLAPPYLAAVAVGVRDLDEAAKALVAGEVPFARDSRGLRVAPEHACGAVLRFQAGG